MGKTITIKVADTFSGQSLTFRTTADKLAAAEETYGRWTWLTRSQRSRLERAFGKPRCYYCTILTSEDSAFHAYN